MACVVPANALTAPVAHGAKNLAVTHAVLMAKYALAAIVAPAAKFAAASVAVTANAVAMSVTPTLMTASLLVTARATESIETVAVSKI